MVPVMRLIFLSWSRSDRGRADAMRGERIADAVSWHLTASLGHHALAAWAEQVRLKCLAEQGVRGLVAAREEMVLQVSFRLWACSCNTDKDSAPALSKAKMSLSLPLLLNLPPSGAPPKLMVGDRIRLVGFQEAHFNCQAGGIVAWSDYESKWIVDMDVGGAKLFSPENLELDIETPRFDVDGSEQGSHATFGIDNGSTFDKDSSPRNSSNAVTSPRRAFTMPWVAEGGGSWKKIERNTRSVDSALKSCSDISTKSSPLSAFGSPHASKTRKTWAAATGRSEGPDHYQRGDYRRLLKTKLGFTSHSGKQRDVSPGVAKKGFFYHGASTAKPGAQKVTDNHLARASPVSTPTQESWQEDGDLQIAGGDPALLSEVATLRAELERLQRVVLQSASLTSSPQFAPSAAAAARDGGGTGGVFAGVTERAEAGGTGASR